MMATGMYGNKNDKTVAYVQAPCVYVNFDIKFIA
jgi:hypothetical protein